MPFDINAVVANAITKRISYYKGHILDSPEQADALKDDHTAILKAIRESFSFPHLQDNAIQLLIELFPTFERWGHWAECLDIYQEALSLELPAEKQVYLHANLARTYLLNRNFDDSLNHLNIGLTIAEEHQVEQLFGLLHHRLMNTYIGRIEYKTAQEHGLRALAYLSGTRSNTLAAAYDSLGRISSNSNNFVMAENYFWEALSLWDYLKDYLHMSRSHHNLAMLFWRQNNLEDAKKHYESALKALGDGEANIGDKFNILNGLGNVNYSLGNLEKAREIYQEGVNQLQYKTEWHGLRGSFTHNLGNTLLALGKPEEARIFLEKALSDWRQANDEIQMGNTIGTLAEAFEATEDWAKAIFNYDEALQLLAKYPDDGWAIKLTNDFNEAKAQCASQL